MLNIISRFLYLFILAFVIFQGILILFPESTTAFYSSISSWLNKPSYEQLKEENNRLKVKITEISNNSSIKEGLENNKNLLQPAERKYTTLIERKDREISDLRASYNRFYQKYQNFKELERDRHDFITRFSMLDDDNNKKLKFLLGFGCTKGKEIVSVRKDTSIPSWGYCLESSFNTYQFVYYDIDRILNHPETFDNVKVISSSANEIVFSYKSDKTYHYIKMILNENGQYNEIYRLKSGSFKKNVKNILIPFKDPLNPNKKFFITIQDWLVKHFPPDAYSHSWEEKVCKDNTDNLCVTLKIYDRIVDKQYDIYWKINISFVFHHLDSEKINDYSIEYKRSVNGKIIEKFPKDYEELIKTHKNLASIISIDQPL